jgi:hypothetical protein
MNLELAHGSHSGTAVQGSPMSQMGQSRPKRDVRVTSAYPSISDIILRRGERRDGVKVRSDRCKMSFPV